MQEILEYLSKHPEAGDTLQNIAEWWIPFERLLPKWSVVQEAVAYLVAQGLISETVLPDGKKFYKVIPAQSTKIAELVQREETQER